VTRGRTPSQTTVLTFYLTWYGLAALFLAAALWLSRGLAAPWRILIGTGVLAVGFATVPVASPDGSVWYPAGAYYLAFGPDWLRTAGVASLVIGVVWFFLAAVGLAVWGFFRTLRTPGLPGEDDDASGG
jgi:hypothetical protein